ncbi:29802_t:CDS:2, partial [Gigaspora margarita]
DNSLPTKKKVVLIYDSELREALLEKFHVAPVVFDSPLEHLQVDLVNLLLYAEHNDGYSYVLTLIDIFSRYVWAISLKDKEGSTIHSKLLVHGRTRHPQSQEKIERFSQTLGRHLTKIMWDEVFEVQAFFGFKMHVVYNTPEDITLENVALEDITLDDIALEDIAPEDIIAPENIIEKIILAATQDSYNQASYEFHVMQVKCVHEKVVQNDETYQNKLVIRESVHRRKVVFEPGDKVVIAPDFDNKQKTRKRKLDQTCSITRKVISMCSNNRTAKVK